MPKFVICDLSFGILDEPQANPPGWLLPCKLRNIAKNRSIYRITAKKRCIDEPVIIS
jgi:hypothetical protein